MFREKTTRKLRFPSLSRIPHNWCHWLMLLFIVLFTKISVSLQFTTDIDSSFFIKPYFRFVFFMHFMFYVQQLGEVYYSNMDYNCIIVLPSNWFHSPCMACDYLQRRNVMWKLCNPSGHDHASPGSGCYVYRMNFVAVVFLMSLHAFYDLVRCFQMPGQTTFYFATSSIVQCDVWVWTLFLMTRD